MSEGVIQMMKRENIIILSMLALLPACDVDTSAYTLYKLDPSNQTERITIQVFKDSNKDEDNLKACHIFRIDLLTKEETEDKYWCEKGGA